MHTNQAVVFGHTQINVKEPENINMCCLCSSLTVLLFILCAACYQPLHGTFPVSVWATTE